MQTQTVTQVENSQLNSTWIKSKPIQSAIFAVAAPLCPAQLPGKRRRPMDSRKRSKGIERKEKKSKKNLWPQKRWCKRLSAPHPLDRWHLKASQTGSAGKNIRSFGHSPVQPVTCHKRVRGREKEKDMTNGQSRSPKRPRMLSIFFLLWSVHFYFFSKFSFQLFFQFELIESAASAAVERMHRKSTTITTPLPSLSHSAAAIPFNWISYFKK